MKNCSQSLVGLQHLDESKFQEGELMVTCRLKTVEDVSAVAKESLVNCLGDSTGLEAGVIPCPVVLILILKDFI